MKDNHYASRTNDPAVMRAQQRLEELLKERGSQPPLVYLVDQDVLRLPPEEYEALVAQDEELARQIHEASRILRKVAPTTPTRR